MVAEIQAVKDSTKIRVSGERGQPKYPRSRSGSGTDSEAAAVLFTGDDGEGGSGRRRGDRRAAEGVAGAAPVRRRAACRRGRRGGGGCSGRGGAGPAAESGAAVWLLRPTEKGAAGAGVEGTDPGKGRRRLAGRGGPRVGPRASAARRSGPATWRDPAG